MKHPWLVLIALSLGLTGCFYEPGRGYGDHGRWDRGQYQVDHDRRGHWGR